MSDKADWQEIDPSDLPEQVRDAYEHYRTLRRQAGEAKGQFEQAMADAAELPAGKRLIFGYNFGKLSMALVDDDREPKRAAKPKLTLGEFMRQQQASGRAV